MKKFYSIFLAGVMMAGMLITGGCDPKNQPENPGGNDVDYDLVLRPTEVNVVVGKTAKIEATVYGYEDYDLSWRSNDKSIATVNNGTVTGVKKGSTTVVCTIVAEGDEFERKCKVNVVDDLIKFNKESLSMVVGNSESLTVKLEVAGTDVTSKCTWASSKTSVATVSAGKVTAVGAGECDITATYGEQKIFCKVSVIEVLRINEKDATLLVGSTLQLTTNRQSATFSSSNTSVAKVDGNGLVTAVAKGTATITAKYNGETATIKVTVTDQLNIVRKASGKAAGSVEVIAIDDAVEFTTNATGTVTWSTSNSAVATVSSGKITGKTCGFVTITATYGKLKATMDVYVGGKFVMDDNEVKYMVFAPGNLEYSSGSYQFAESPYSASTFTYSEMCTVSKAPIKYKNKTFDTGFWIIPYNPGYPNLSPGNLMKKHRYAPVHVDPMHGWGFLFAPHGKPAPYTVSTGSQNISEEDLYQWIKQGYVYFPIVYNTDNYYFNYLFENQYSCWRFFTPYKDTWYAAVRSYNESSEKGAIRMVHVYEY